eukprot:20816-Heterococcus_DN1.PRE.1
MSACCSLSLQCAATALRMSDDSSDVLADLEALDSVLSDDNDDSDLEPRQPYLNNLAMQAAKREWQKQAGDSGSAQVQCSCLWHIYSKYVQATACSTANILNTDHFATRASECPGSSASIAVAVPVAMMTERIIYLTKHLQTHPKDFHSRRGLIALVNKRKTQLNFLLHDMLSVESSKASSVPLCTRQSRQMSIGYRICNACGKSLLWCMQHAMDVSIALVITNSPTIVASSSRFERSSVCVITLTLYHYTLLLTAALLQQPPQFDTQPLKCLEMCQALGIRFKPKSAVQSREVKYSSFKNTKSKIGMIKAAELQTRALQARQAEKAAANAK